MEDYAQDTIEITKETYSEEEDEQELKQPNNKKGVKLHTIESKLKIIKYAKENDRKSASLKYQIPQSTLGDWMRNEKNLANVSSENLKNKTLHKGRKILYPEIEIQLV